MIQLSLKQILSEQFTIEITPFHCQELVKAVLRYEVRGDNMAAFNSPFLGVNKAYFLDRDASAIFDIVRIDKLAFNRAVKRCSSISSSWNVTGNDFNILVVWLVHLLSQTKTVPQKTAYDTQFSLLKLLHYKFFTGKVSTMFKHGVNEGVMEYTINNLNAKSDIKKTETSTWKLLIEDHVRQVLDPTGIHKKTIQDFEPDKAVIYFLSDMHTRISAKIKNIAEEYYANHAKGNTTKTTSLVQTNSEGEKELGDLKATLDNVIIRIQNMALNTNTFINFQHVRLAATIANVRPEILRDILTAFSLMATMQYKAHTGNETKLQDKQTIYVGYMILIYELIQKSYRRCAQMGCDMNSNVKILEKTRDAFRASRILDESILSIKNSVDYFISEHMHYTREAVAVAARTAFILYIIILSFNK